MITRGVRIVRVANGKALVDDLRSIRARWDELVNARRDSGVWQLADLLIRHPVANADVVAREFGVSKTNVYRLIEPLRDSGIIGAMPVSGLSMPRG